MAECVHSDVLSTGQRIDVPMCRRQDAGADRSRTRDTQVRARFQRARLRRRHRHWTPNPGTKRRHRAPGHLLDGHLGQGHKTGHDTD